MCNAKEKRGDKDADELNVVGCGACDVCEIDDLRTCMRDLETDSHCQ